MLNRITKIRNMDVKPKTNKKTSDYLAPKPVEPLDRIHNWHNHVKFCPICGSSMSIFFFFKLKCINKKCNNQNIMKPETLKKANEIDNDINRIYHEIKYLEDVLKTHKTEISIYGISIILSKKEMPYLQMICDSLKERQAELEKELDSL